MDRRVLILPVASIIIVLVLLTRPDITGFITARPAGPESSKNSANISIRINEDGFIPEDSVVTVYLDDRSSGMDFKEFVKRTGIGYNRVYKENPKIGYVGYGYAGERIYSLDLSEFGFDTSAGPGTHKLVIEITYKNYVLSNTSKTIELS